MPSPRVSIVIPVRNRRDLIGQLLDALDRQSYQDFEVVVVDDGSTDGADGEVLARQREDSRIRLIRSEGAGAVRARQLGVKESDGDILAFTDSDCIPDPLWLEAGVAAVDLGYQMVNGLTLPTRAVGPLERSVASASEGLYPTCNMFFHRDAFECFGGFDELAEHRLGFRFNERARGTGFGEDTILAWRMIRAGVSYMHAPEAIVRHHVFPADPIEWLSRGLQMAAFPALVREVPELRATLLEHGVLLGPRNRLPIYALLLFAALRCRRLFAVSLGWWLATSITSVAKSPGSWRSKSIWLGMDMIVDVEIGLSLIVGSIRNRCLVL